MEKKSFILYGDYQSHFQMMSREEQGDLIMAIFAYEEGGDIPPLTPMAAMAFSFISKQLDRDEEKYNEVCQSRREAGKRSGEARRNKEEQKRTKGTSVQFVQQNGTKGTDTDTDTENETGTDTVTVTENENETETGDDTSSTYPPKSPQGGRGAGAKKEEPRGFELFWEMYPRKEARGEALKAWQALNPSLELETDILAHVQKRRECWEWTKEGGRYVPHAASFLNQHRWEDEYTLAPPPSASTYGRQEERCTFADLYREQFGEVCAL